MPHACEDGFIQALPEAGTPKFASGDAADLAGLGVLTACWGARSLAERGWASSRGRCAWLALPSHRHGGDLRPDAVEFGVVRDGLEVVAGGVGGGERGGLVIGQLDVERCHGVVDLRGRARAH
jgi:hypothetical protein